MPATSGSLLLLSPFQTGQPKSGASESMRKWWLEQVRFNEVACPDRKAPLNAARLPKTANLSDCDGKSPQQLMIKLTHRQLASMASEWLRLCEPSAAQYPLNGSGGSPPWWPENIQYKKPDLLKNQALTEVRGPEHYVFWMRMRKVLC